MVDESELARLLSQVVFDTTITHVEGLDPFRRLLEKDVGGQVLRFLNRKIHKLEGKRRGGIAFVVAEHYRQRGDLKKLEELFATDDPEVKESVLNALWAEPGSNPEMAPGIINLALQGAVHPSPAVRTESCYVFQNQCDWGVDVTAAIEPLRLLLDDRNNRVRHQAAHALGNMAKNKYDMSRHIGPLGRNVIHENRFVREASTWALWQLSKCKHDIGPAVPALAKSLADDDEWDKPRKNATGALLHHARKSAANAVRVRDVVKDVHLDLQRKEIKKFLDQLGNLE